MNWIDKIAVWLIFSCIMGSSLSFVWIVFSNLFWRKSNPRIAYAGLKAALIMMYVPINYLWLNTLPKSDENGEVITFLPSVTNGISKSFEKLVTIWLFGVLVCAVKHYFESVRIRKRLSVKLPLEKHQLILLEKKKNQLNIKKSIYAYRCYNAPSPFIMGVIKPTIYIPVFDYTDEQLELIFTHELYHHKNHDAIWKKFVAFSAILFWYNPLLISTIYYNNRWAEADCDSDCLSHYGHSEYFNIIMNMKINNTGMMPAYSMLKRENTELLWRVRTVKKRTKNKISKYALGMSFFGLIVFSSLTVYAATDVANEMYEKAYMDTIVYIEMKLDDTEFDGDMGLYGDAGIEYIEITQGAEAFEPEDTCASENARLDEILYGADCKYGKFFSAVNDSYFRFYEMSIDAGSVIICDEEWFEAGEILYFGFGIEPVYTEAYIGIVNSNDNVVYVSGKDYINHRFSIDESGFYRVFVKITGDEDAFVTGSYIKEDTGG